MRARTGAPRLLALLGAFAIATALGAQLAIAQGAGPAAADRIERQLAELDDGTESATDVSPPPKVTARSWLVYDSGIAEPVAAQDAGTPRPVASLAKLMTALLVTERMQLDEPVTIPAEVNDLSADASRMDARAGEKWPAKDLLRAMVAHSANDAAIALAAHVGDGDQDAFVKLMNERAAELGMTDTEFASPTGFDPPGSANTSTPIDYVPLVEAALADDDIRAAMAEEKITLQRPGGGKPIVLPNRNPLLGTYEGVDAGKTGFTDAAGYMLAVHHEDAANGGDLIVLTFASSSEKTRVSDARALLDWARALRVDVRLVEGGTPYGSIPVQRSDERVEVFACDDLVVNARVGQEVVREVVLPRSIVAPVATGDEVGELRAVVGSPRDEDTSVEPESVPLCSGSTIKERSTADRLIEYAGDYRDAWDRGVDEVRDTWASLSEAA